MVIAGGNGLFAKKYIGLSASLLLGVGITAIVISYIALYAQGEFVPFLAAYIMYISGVTWWLTLIREKGKALKKQSRELKIYLKQIGLQSIFLITALMLPWVTIFGSIHTLDNFGSLFEMTQHIFRDLPIDNQISSLLAKASLNDEYTSPLFGDWLGSDRPPLQSGFIIFSYPTFKFLNFDWNLSSYISSVTANSVWLFGGFAFLENLIKKKKLVFLAYIPAILSGYILLNTTYSWPKPLAAGMLLGCLATISINSGERQNKKRLLLSGLLLGFACLSHGASFFAVPAIAIVVIYMSCQRKNISKALSLLFIQFLPFFLIQIPWIAWQKLIDPPADRLLKWHLAGQVAITDSKFLGILHLNYSKAEYSEILSNKIRNIQALYAHPKDEILDAFTSWHLILSGKYTVAISNEFFSTSTAILTWTLPTILLIILFLPFSKHFSISSMINQKVLMISFMVFGVTIIFWCLAMFGPATTVIHQGTGITILIPLLLLGSTFACISPRIALTGSTIQAIGTSYIYKGESNIIFQSAFVILALISSYLAYYIGTQREFNLAKDEQQD